MTRSVTGPRRSAGALLAGLAAVLLSAAAGGVDLKIGYVDVQRILDTAPQAVEGRERIEKEFVQRDRELDAAESDMRKRTQELIDQVNEISLTERRSRESELRTLSREIRRKRDYLREDLAQRRAVESGKFQSRVTDLIREVAKAEKYDMVLMYGILHASEVVDITDKILRRLEKEAGK